MLELATTKDLELVEERVKDLTKEFGKLQHSLQLMVKKVQRLEKDNEILMKMHVVNVVNVEDEPKSKKVATKTIKPRKKATKKEV